MIRALTGGDITKEERIMKMDTWRALTELDAKAREAEELRKAINTLWLKDGRTQIILHSPTGSGKTFMTCALVNSLQDITPEDVNLGDVAYFWITMNNELAMQSKKKFEQYFTPNLRNTLSSFDDCNNTLRQNEVLFANWQKLAQKNPAS